MLAAVILSRYFNKIEYGTYRQILYIYTTLLVVFSLGLPNVFAYFLPRFKKEEGYSIVLKVNNILFLVGIIFSAFLFFFSNSIALLLNNKELSMGLKIFSPMPILMLPTIGLEGIFSTYKKTLYLAKYQIITRTIMLLCIIVPVILLESSYQYALYGWLFSSVISLIIALNFKKIPFRGIITKKTDLTYKQILTFSLPLSIAGFWGILIKSAPQFFISRNFGAEFFAIFSNGFIELPFVSMVTVAASTILLPYFSQLVHNNTNVEELVKVWKSTLVKSTMIIYPIVIFFLINSNNIIQLLYTNSYSQSVIYFQIAMSLNFFNIIIFAPLIFAFGKTKFYLLIHFLIAFLLWGLSYVSSFFFYNPIVFAILYVILKIIMVLIFLYFSSGLLGKKIIQIIPLKKIVIIFVHSLIVGILINLFISINFYDISMFLNLSVNFFFFSIIVFFTGPLFGIKYLNLLKTFLKK